MRDGSCSSTFLILLEESHKLPAMRFLIGQQSDTKIRIVDSFAEANDFVIAGNINHNPLPLFFDWCCWELALLG